MQKQKIIKIVLVGLIAIMPVFLGGCKKKCPKPEDNIPGTSVFRQECAFEDVGGSQTGLKELDFYFVYDNTDAFKEQIQAFQSKNQGLVVRTKKFVDLNEYEDAVIGGIAEGEGPDVFMIPNAWVTKHWKKFMPMPLDLPIVMTPELFFWTRILI